MINLAVIGAGYWGPNLIRNFSQIKDVNLKTICDKDDGTLSTLKLKYPAVNFVSDYNQVLEEPTLNCCVIATPAKSHFEIAKKALENGLDVFVEKPLSLKIEQAEELVNLAKSKNRILMVGHLMRYHPGINYIKEYITSDKMGKLFYLYAQRLNLGKIRKDENVLWSFAPHDISIILYLVEKKPVEVSARGQFYIQKGIEDVVFFTIIFEDNTLANVHISWLDPHKERKLVVVGEKKMLTFDDMQASEKIKIYDKGVNYEGSFLTYDDSLTLREGDIFIPRIVMKEPLMLECSHFIECITKRKIPITDGEEGLKVLKVLNAVEESKKRKGAAVEII